MQVIPFQKNKDTFQLRESSRELPIVKWLGFVIQATLRSVIPEALTRSNMSLFFANGIIYGLLKAFCLHHQMLRELNLAILRYQLCIQA